MKTVNEMALYLWKRVELIFSIDYPGGGLGITRWEEIKKLFQMFPIFTGQVMAEYNEKGLNSELPILMVVKEYLKSFSSDGEKSYEITRFLDEKYKDCGASWSAGGTFLCASAGAKAFIGPDGEIFAYRLTWSNSTGSSKSSITVPAPVPSVTRELDSFNHFHGESGKDTNYQILPRQDWKAVVNRWKEIQKAKQVRLDTEARMSWRTGAEFYFGITSRGGYYEPHASVGTKKYVPQHEHDSSGTDLYKIKIMPCVPYGYYKFYVRECPISLYLKEGEEPRISLCASHSWCDKQSWWLDHHDSTNIERGWIFVNSQDVYENTIQTINKKKAEKLAERQQKFAEAKAKAMEVGFTETEISQIIKLADKGQVINTLKLVTTMVAKYSPVFILEIFNYISGENPEVIENYAYLVANAGEIQLSNVKMATKNAYARSYINNLIPGYTTGGHFDFYMRALSLALANKVPFNNGDTGENCESDLAVKLREAGLSK